MHLLVSAWTVTSLITPTSAEHRPAQGTPASSLAVAACADILAAQALHAMPGRQMWTVHDLHFFKCNVFCEAPNKLGSMAGQRKEVLSNQNPHCTREEIHSLQRQQVKMKSRQ